MNLFKGRLLELKYKRNLLNKVIVRIDFVNKISSLTNQLSKNVIKEAMENNFPIIEPGESILYDMQIKASDDKQRQETRKISDWNFYGKNREKQLHINWENMFILFNKYNSFDELKNNFINIAKKLFENYSSELQVRRLGLRYINNLEIPAKNLFSWELYLNKNMLSIFKIAEEKKQIARAFHNLEINYGDFLLRIQYGMNNPDYPAPIRRKLFILDFDAYSQKVFDLKGIEDSLPIYHKKIEEYFEKLITEKIRKKLNE